MHFNLLEIKYLILLFFNPGTIAKIAVTIDKTLSLLYIYIIKKVGVITLSTAI